MVAALSHELNNPVGVIASNLATQEKWIQRIAEAFSLIPTNLDKVNKLLGIGQELNQGSVLALKRIRVMLERLREFTHLDEAETKYVDVNHELLTALEMVKSEIGTEVQIQKDLGTLPQIISKPGKLNLAFASLIRNALQAINQQGVIKLFSSHKNGNVEITD